MMCLMLYTDGWCLVLWFIIQHRKRKWVRNHGCIFISYKLILFLRTSKEKHGSNEREWWNTLSFCMLHLPSIGSKHLFQLNARKSACFCLPLWQNLVALNENRLELDAGTEQVPTWKWPENTVAIINNEKRETCVVPRQLDMGWSCIYKDLGNPT